MLDSLKENPEVGKYVMPMKLGLRTVFAEVDAEGAMPKTVFDFPDSNSAKKEALEVCDYVAKKVFNHD
jgi:chromosome partitioning protein